MPRFEVDAPFYEGIEDFTFFSRSDQLNQLFREPRPPNIRDQQMDETIVLRPGDSKSSVVGRLNVSSCYGREFISCSFRATGALPKHALSQYHTKYCIDNSGYNPKPRTPNPNSDVRHNCASGSVSLSGQRYLSSVEDLCDLLYHRIFPSASGTHGLVVIAGATASGKSKIVRGIIFKYLKHLVESANGSGRRPHLVTFEDPIDKLWADDPGAAKLTGVDYTPREFKKDVMSLDLAVEAALRQTPNVFFVGETRNPDDWHVLLQFAATGHLCLTTSHAGSLTEAMGQLFHAVRADTPVRRAEVASRILALVHLRSSRLQAERDTKIGQLSITIPAVWVRSQRSTKALMADGLAALLPCWDALNWDENPGTAGEMGCLGRNWFAEHLMSRAQADVKSNFDRELRRMALSWDLEGI